VKPKNKPTENNKSMLHIKNASPEHPSNTARSYPESAAASNISRYHPG